MGRFSSFAYTGLTDRLRNLESFQAQLIR